MNAVISVCYYIVLLIWSLAYFVFMLVLYAVTVAFDRERVVLHAASRFWARSFFRLNPLWRLRIEGREHIDPKAAYVITVNHQSMLDIPLMYALPRLNFKWVSKKEVYKWPLFGVVLWLHGDITVDTKGSVRKTKAFMEQGCEHLRRGTSVIIFPEGTRSRDGEIHNFKEGALLLAREAGTPVLPCVIDGGKTFAQGWQVRRNTFTIRILPPVPARAVQETETRALMAGVRATMTDTLHTLRTAEGKANPTHTI